jgi:hypothetical protein
MGMGTAVHRHGHRSASARGLHVTTTAKGGNVHLFGIDTGATTRLLFSHTTYDDGLRTETRAIVLP